MLIEVVTAKSSHKIKLILPVSQAQTQILNVIRTAQIVYGTIIYS